MEPLASIHEKEIEENAKIMAFVADSIKITGEKSDSIKADDLYTLYLDQTEGKTVKSGTFKNRFETMFPDAKYEMQEENGFVEQVVVGIKLKTKKPCQTAEQKSLS